MATRNSKRKKDEVDATEADTSDLLMELKTDIKDIKCTLFSVLTKLDEIISENVCLKREVSCLKKVISASKSNRNSAEKVTYADKVKNSEPVIVIVPKNSTQKCDETKTDLANNISPSKLNIDTIRRAAKGAIVVQCQDQQSSTLLKETTGTLSEKYDIKTPAQRKPRLKIVNMSDEPNNNVVEQIRKQNKFVSADAKLLVVKTLKHTRNDSTNYTLIIETDIDTFNTIIKQEKLSIGWDRCRVFEHFYVSRCYKCLGFNHSAKVCTKKQACIKCGGEHERKDCTSETMKCINCVNAMSRLNIELDVDHEAYSTDCTVWKRRMEREQQRPMEN